MTDLTADRQDIVELVAKMRDLASKRMPYFDAAADALESLATECDRLRAIIDSRPAINAGLPETYIEWSQSIYLADYATTVGHDA